MTLRNFSLLFFVAAIVVTITACQKENNTGTTNFKVRLTDNPFNATEVNIDIREVRVNLRDDSSGWASLNTIAGIYNILDFQNGVDTVLAQGNIPTGTLKEIRFVLGDDNSIVINSIKYPLVIPSGSESGLKIKLNKRLNATFDSLLIDFDAALSIIQTGAGDFKLKPVLKIK